MKVAIVINRLDVGGAETVTRQLALGARSLGCQIHVVAVRGGGAVATTLAAEGIPVRSLDRAPGLLRSPLATTAAALHLGHALRRQGVHLLHGMLFEGNTVARLAARRAGLRCVSTYHTSHLLQPVESSVEAWTGHWVSAHIAVSEAVADLAARELGIARRSFHVIHNGVRVDESASPPHAVHTLGFLGRLHEDKGLHVLLEALALRPDLGLTLRVAGDGPRRDALQRQAHRRGLGNRVQFLGTVHDSQAFLRSIDALVLPSVHEGLSVSALEAMACARPVIASDVAGNRELVVDGSTGLLVPAGEVLALSSALDRLCTTVDVESMGTAARLRVARCFSEQSMVERTIQLWRSVVAAPLPWITQDC
ncbi:MAG: glycosyltransferase [Pseudomonadota bacterium]